ncbi:hypothetical protein XcmpCFBP7700_08220 [Xanthomonas campestris]|uniref:hypothetical protein n=1 Tax=Xanthomonas TaxID=338 RepID=UPI0004677A64|nr:MULTISPECIES: hypothetical protein [Xanthomonas]PPT18955.1 hypothetical protein XarCFBP6771_15035 [Xanthomonas arboricola]RJU11183.1 hypothetical protein XcmpCFBP7700_08220 [Xanthomonas campestris]SOU11899.1 hypothetical protein LMG19145_03027 [Xanthomonas arboricola pv. fragariae]
MRELYIPKELGVRLYFDGEQPKSSSSESGFEQALATIEKNRSELITAVVLLEDRMIEAVGTLLFRTPTSGDLEREFFTKEIMGTSDFSFAFKRRVFTRILEQTKALDAAKIQAVKAALSNIIAWRNAFAHGKVLHELNGGFLLQYYSGGHQELVLDDAFFEKVEATMRHCLYTCNDVIQRARLDPGDECT